MKQAQEYSHLSLKTLGYTALGIGAILYYSEIGSHLVGEYYFGRTVSPFFDFAVLLLISVLSLTAVGCSIHIRAIGGLERGELERELLQGLAELRAIKALGESALSEVESILPRHAAGLSTRGAESLRLLKQILNAIDRRYHLVQDLNTKHRTPELCRAVEILRKKLRSIESAHSNLIDVDPFPAIPADKLVSVVSQLISEVRIGLKMAA